MKPLEIREQCPDCRVNIGEYHLPGCDIERCPLCGVQMLQDECRYTYFGIEMMDMEEEWEWVYEHGLPKKMDAIYEAYIQPFLLPWDGVWPGVKECREYGFWTKWTDHGWEKCDEDDPEASEGLNELAEKSVWDKEQKKYVCLEEQLQ